MKKVLIITYYFPPSGGSGVQRWLKMIKYLPQYGVEPVVLTVHPNSASYPQYDASLLADVSPQTIIHRTKSNEILSLYKKISPTKELPHTGFANEPNPTFLQKVSRFIRGNFFLPDARRGWNKYAYQQAVQIIQNEGIDTVITTSPPHSTQLVGLQLKKKFPHIKWLADLRDPWTELFYNSQLYRLPLAKKIDGKYEKIVVETADVVMTVSNDCARSFAKNARPKQPIKVLYNGYDEEDFKNVTPVNKGPKKVLSYIGTLGDNYGMEVLIQALKSLEKEASQQLLLRFVGGVSHRVKQQLGELNYEVEYIGYVSHQKAVDYMCSADMLLLCIPQTKDNAGILTGKIFEYIAAQKPILLLGPPQGDAAKLLAEIGGGYCVGYRADLATQTLRLWLNEEVVFLRKSADSQAFSRKEIAGKLAKLLKE